MAKPFRGLIFGARLHFESNRFISSCAQQDFRLMEFLLVGLDLLRRQRTESFLTLPADKKRAEHTAITALDAPVEWKEF